MVHGYGCIDIIIKRSALGTDNSKELIEFRKIKPEFYDDDLICIPGGMNPMDVQSSVNDLELSYGVQILDISDPQNKKAKDGVIISAPYGTTTPCDWIIYDSFGKGWRLKTELDWDSVQWLSYYRKAKITKNYNVIRKLQVEVFRNTYKIVNNGGYFINGKKVDIQKSPKSTMFFSEINVTPERSNSNGVEISVVNEDCLKLAAEYEKENPLVLNMANRQTPGGGVEIGSCAQEECLFRSSNYFATMYPLRELYPMDRNHGCIYSPGVTVFRGLESDGYPLLEKPFTTNFVAVSALNGPHLTESGDYTDEERESMKNKIRAMLNVGIVFNHKTLILSAFGCGAFSNPPEKVAQLFKEILQEYKYRYFFNKIIFAIKSDHNDVNNENYDAFAKVFG